MVFMVLGGQMHTAESLVPEPICFEIEIAIEKLRRCKSWSTDQMPVELIKAWDSVLHSEIYRHINPILNREELPQQWNESNILPIYKSGNKTDSRNYRRISLLPTTYKIISSILLWRLV